jgi:hypothetical protein
MAGEYVVGLRPTDFQRETSSGSDPNVVVSDFVGDLRALKLNKYKTSNNVNYGYTTTFRLPASITYTTGVTAKIYLTNLDAGDAGKKCYVGVTVKRLAADETTDIDSGAGTEQLVSVTLSSTNGGIAIGSLAIANANLDSAGAGDMVLIRLRRKSTDGTNDTALGPVALIGVDVANT